MTALSLRARRVLQSPLVWILAAALVLRLVGIGWGLPASDAWDNDGVAPRDFWPGLIETFTPGHYFTYPPAHLALLALLTAPITAVVLLRAPALTRDAVLGEALKVPYMTGYSLFARGLSVAMSLGIVLAVGAMAREVAGRRAGYAAAAACAVNVTLTYYAHTSNLDVPYLFWAVLALLVLVRAMARGEPRRLRAVGALAALAVASKDQSYALFALGVPLAVGLGAAFGAWRDLAPRALLRELGLAVGLGAAILAVVDWAVFNPSGFLARLRFLVGPATAPYAYYSADALGRAYALADSVRRFGEHYPLALAPLAVAGLVRAATLAEGRVRGAALVPACAIVSYTLLFNCVARRTEQRFLLPQTVLWAPYAGIGMDSLIAWAQGRKPLAALVWAACGGILAWGAFRCADVDANLILDPRYDAEAWLAQHVASGDVLEVHGKSVYLLRPPPQAHVVRVGPEPVGGRNPLFGAEERQDALGNIASRAPRWIVVNEVYAWQYLDHGPAATIGRVHSGTQLMASENVDAARFFQGLLDGSLGYRMAHRSAWSSTFWPRLDTHGSLGREVWVFERGPG
jgi:hypothetical protein